MPDTKSSLDIIRDALAERAKITIAQTQARRDERDRVEGRHSFIYRDVPEDLNNDSINRERIFNDRRAWTR